MSTDHQACPLCGGGELSRLFPELPVLVRCGDCAFVWRRRDGEGESLYHEEFFTDDVYYTAYFERAQQWRYEARRRLEWLLTAAKPGRLLEVGSGGGFFLEAAVEAGIEAVGVEPARDGAEYASKELGVEVLIGGFEDAELPGTYDAICAFHVLEHVDDPRRFLAKARALLAPTGVLALEVPNVGSPRARRDRTRWAHLQPEYHVSHFNATTLRRIVSEAGFEPFVVDTVFPRYYMDARSLIRPSGLVELARQLRAHPSLRETHPTAGDLLRLLARPAGPPQSERS